MSHYGDSVTGGYPNSFNAFAEYDSMPANFFDSLGGHWCDCNTNVGFKNRASDKNAGTMILYPNPSETMIIIELPDYSPATDANLEIITMDGRLLESQPIKTKINHFDISSFPEGIYIAKIVLPEVVLVKKFIKR